MTVRIDRIVTSGVFSLDGQDFAVDNNVWLVGNDGEVLVIDAAHDAEAILEAVGSRTVKAIVSTHGHNDHVNAAPDIARATGAPVLLHLDVLTDGDVLSVAGSELRVLHTPGHSPGGVCLFCTPQTSPPSSPATPSSRADPVRPDGPTPT
jgi:glyoxylase-like metal-dependent hydrolase (beta-lactamase superfamily II)